MKADLFAQRLGFPLDGFQSQALKILDAGSSVVVAAPTGSGKTVVAEYAVAKALDLGGKAFYTTPLKALSNQKYSDLCRVYGNDKVGLLTGDTSHNGEAPVVVMTTEVLRNMLYAGSATLQGLRYVVLDEVHFLGDRDRGPVWEEVIIHTPPEVDMVCLSATVSNAEEFAAWVGTVRGGTEAVIEERRPVELVHRYLVADRRSHEMNLIDTFVDGSPNPAGAFTDTPLSSLGAAGRGRGAHRGGRWRPPRREEVVELLRDKGMLPAITFIFSRAGCDDAVRQCLASGLRLTTSDERHQIRQIVDAKLENLTDSDLRALGWQEWMTGLEAGFAAHHAGLVPAFKEAVESCFSAGLAKAVFATETLALGINMPARTVVIEKLAKFGGERHQLLTPGEYTQLTGRAGRRGIDPVGYAVVVWSPFVAFSAVAGLASTRTFGLSSAFRPTYNMAVNLVRRFDPDQARHLMNLSFAQYQADRSVVGLEAQLERSRRMLAKAQGDAACDLGDMAAYRQSLGNRPNPPGRHRSTRRRGPAPPGPVADSKPSPSADVSAVAGCPSLRRHLMAATRADRLEVETARLVRRVQSRNDSLARRLDRVLGLLERWGYVENWQLSASGEALAGTYSDADLLVVECLRRGLLDGLTPPEMASLVSVFVFEGRRGSRGPNSEPRFPSKKLAERWECVAVVAGELRALEEASQIPPTRFPDAGFMAAAHLWAGGANLGVVLDDEEMTGGDFVRIVKQLLDLIKGIAVVAVGTETSKSAERAASAIMRGVVSAASVVAESAEADTDVLAQQVPSDA
ncbi:MAG: DEAD/DEAH box helicase [Acidimicrobiales bacterium]